MGKSKEISKTSGRETGGVPGMNVVWLEICVPMEAAQSFSEKKIPVPTQAKSSLSDKEASTPKSTSNIQVTCANVHRDKALNI